MKDKDNVTLSAEEVSAMQAEMAELKKKLDLSEKVKELEAALSEKEAAIAEKEQEVFDKAAEVESEKEAHNAEVKDLNNKLSEAKEENKTILAFLQEQVKKVALAAGKKDVEVPSDLGGISAMLEENQQLLATLVPAGGVSKAVNYADEDNKFNSVQLESYQVRR